MSHASHLLLLLEANISWLFLTTALEFPNCTEVLLLGHGRSRMRAIYAEHKFVCFFCRSCDSG
ncbi:unnamed protein product [Ixodes persulcatus]